MALGSPAQRGEEVPMSPGELEAYERRRLQELRVKRLSESRQMYSAFTKSRAQQFCKVKDADEARRKRLMSEDDRAAAEDQVAKLQDRLMEAQRLRGAAMRSAAELSDAEEKKRAARREAAEREELLRRERFEEALAEVRCNNPMRKKAEIVKRQKSARARAQEVCEERLQARRVVLAREAEDQMQQDAVAAEELAKAMRPHVRLELGRTFFHQSYGQLPVTAGDYQAALQAHQKQADDDSRRREALMLKIADEAKRDALVDRAWDGLIKELDLIMEREAGETQVLVAEEALRRVAEGDAVERGVEETYRVEWRAEERERQMRDWLDDGDVAPRAEMPRPTSPASEGHVEE